MPLRDRIWWRTVRISPPYPLLPFLSLLRYVVRRHGRNIIPCAIIKAHQHLNNAQSLQSVYGHQGEVRICDGPGFALYIYFYLEYRQFTQITQSIYQQLAEGVLSVGSSCVSTSLLSHTEDANDTSTPVSSEKVFYYTITHLI